MERLSRPRAVKSYANDAYRRLVGGDADAAVMTIERAFSGNVRIAEQIFRLAKAARQGRAWEEVISLAPEPSDADALAPAADRWFRLSVRQMPAVPGSVRRAMLTVWRIAEITGERRQEEDSFQRLQQIIDYLDRAPAGFMSADGSGRIQYLNATLAQWLNLDLAEASSGELGLSDILSGDASALLTRAGDALVLPENRRLDIDLVRGDGTRLPVRILHKRAGTDDNPDRLSHMLVLNRSADAAGDDGGRAAEIRFSRFFHTAPIAIATVDAERGHIGSSNAAFLRMFANQDEGIVNGDTPLGDLFGAEARAAMDSALKSARTRPSSHMNPRSTSPLAKT